MSESCEQNTGVLTETSNFQNIIWPTCTKTPFPRDHEHKVINFTCQKTAVFQLVVLYEVLGSRYHFPLWRWQFVIQMGSRGYADLCRWTPRGKQPKFCVWCLGEETQEALLVLCWLGSPSSDSLDFSRREKDAWIFGYSRAKQSPTSWKVPNSDIRELPILNMNDEPGIWRKTLYHMGKFSSLRNRSKWGQVE